MLQDRKTLLISNFYKKHGFDPNLVEPQRFSEKLLARLIYDDDPYYPLYGTKLIAPYFLAKRSIPGLRFAQRFKVKRHLEVSDFDDIPNAFVVKSSFGSGLNRIVADKSKSDIGKICTLFNEGLFRIMNARAQRDPTNCAIFEEYLAGPDGKTPDDLKFHCFRSADGRSQLILQLDSNRFGNHRQSFFDEAFQPLDLGFSDMQRHEIPPQLPKHFENLVRIVRAISDGFDYIRVDLFNVDDQIFFGELTPFHRGGMAKVVTEEWDRRLGEMWDMRMPAYSGPYDLSVICSSDVHQKSFGGK